MVHPSKNRIYFGLFLDFFEPTMLFSGNTIGLTRFAHLLSEIARSRNKMPLHEVRDFVSVRNTEINLAIVDVAGGMRHANPDSIAHFNWTLTEDLADTFARRIKAVAESESPSHDYLDCDALDDVQVVVSAREYDDLFMDKNTPVNN